MSSVRRGAAGGAPDAEVTMREREGFLNRLEERLSRIAGWLAERQRGEEHAGLARIEAFRRDIADARRAVAETATADLARVRASLDDMRADYDAPPPHTALSRAELDTFRRHFNTTARLLGDMSNLDSPNWTAAYEEYERSWQEVEHAFESKGGTAAPPAV